MFTNMLEKILAVSQKLCDIWFARIPRKLKNSFSSKMVAHRGAHNNGNLENTLPAFKSCLEAGVWAIELDVRWTLDGEPVVHHDEHCGRIFQRPDIVIAEVLFKNLRQQLPQIPLLAEVVKEVTPQVHLMIELKSFLNSHQETKLNEILKFLKPIENFHLLSLKSEHLTSLKNFDRKCFVGVSEFNDAKYFKLCCDQQWGGYATHYLLLSSSQIDTLHQQGLRAGVGYISSKNSWIRETNRQVDWLFSNHALRLQKMI
ncbi:MAG: glycerophosphodiester phosphodiesterase [Bdellovibrionales bacterium]|nr:glycerophosphodiester phosphodiesterase [Bdellovibrionales bacterium]